MLSASAPSPTPALHAYVGTYAPRGGGLHALTLAAVPPALAGLPRVADEHSPTWLCVDAARQRLHAVHELYRRPSDGHGRLSSFEILPDGGLRLLGSVDSGGCRPVHLSLHPGGRHAFVAHHDSASVAVLAVEPDGRLGAVLDVRHSAEAFAAGEAALGPAQAERAPPGSFACSGHDAPHAHMALPDPRGDIVLSTDLGLDALIAWRFDAVSGRLRSPRRVQLSPGAGPRHLVFHPREPAWVYLLNEEASTLAWLRLDAHTGELKLLGELSSLPPGFAGTSYASDLVCSADGRHLYALNRLHDSMAHFTLSRSGAPRLAGVEWCRGSYPRTLSLTPDGRRLVVCNERSDHLAWFALNEDGSPCFSGHYTGVGGPAAVVFVFVQGPAPLCDGAGPSG